MTRLVTYQLLQVLAVWMLAWSTISKVLAASSLPLPPPKLTSDNFDELTQNKSIFFRFVIDNEMCQECEESVDSWNELSKEWENHPIGLVLEVYCDSPDQEEICEEFEIAGYPSIYWGDPNSPEIYKGNLDYESLSTFAKDKVSTLPCGIHNLEVCEGKVKKIVGKLQKKSQEELEALEKEVLKQVDEEQKRFDKAALKLQQQYQDLANNFNTKIDKLREDSGFKWIQQILNAMEEKKLGEANQEMEAEESEGGNQDEL